MAQKTQLNPKGAHTTQTKVREMDDKGFFGRNRLYYFWMLKKYKERVRLEKLKYWMFQKDMKLHQEKNERKIKAKHLSKRNQYDMDSR